MGYETAARIAREANLTGKSVRELILRDKVLTPEQMEKILDPFEMTSPGIAGSQKKQERAWWEEEPEEHAKS